MNIFAAQIV